MLRQQSWWLVIDAVAQHEETTWPIFRGGNFLKKRSCVANTEQSRSFKYISTSLTVHFQLSCV